VSGGTTVLETVFVMLIATVLTALVIEGAFRVYEAVRAFQINKKWNDDAIPLHLGN